MIRAAHVLGVAAGVVHYGHGVVAADVEKCAQFFVASAHDHDRLAGYRGGDILAWIFKLLEPRGKLPGARENVEPLEVGDSRVGIPRCGNCVGFGERSVGVVGGENFLNRLLGWPFHLLHSEL